MLEDHFRGEVGPNLELDDEFIFIIISLLNRYGGSVPILDNCKIHFISFKLAPTHF